MPTFPTYTVLELKCRKWGGKRAGAGLVRISLIINVLEIIYELKKEVNSLDKTGNKCNASATNTRGIKLE